MTKPPPPSEAAVLVSGPRRTFIMTERPIIRHRSSKSGGPGNEGTRDAGEGSSSRPMARQRFVVDTLLAWSRVSALPEISSIVSCVRERAARRDISRGGPGEPSMKRREFIGALGSAAFLSSTSSMAQQPKKIHRIGVLWHGANAEEEAIYLAALRQGLDDFGYVEGQTSF
jgi:hypothetical protein